MPWLFMAFFHIHMPDMDIFYPDREQFMDIFYPVVFRAIISEIKEPSNLKQNSCNRLTDFPLEGGRGVFYM
jgi:hypothetical protein